MREKKRIYVGFFVCVLGFFRDTWDWEGCVCVFRIDSVLGAGGRGLKQQDHLIPGFESNLSNTVKPCLNIKKKKKG